MLHHLRQLYLAAQKKERIILGLMSGTSLDGLDMALCSVAGSGLQTTLRLLHFETVPFNDDFKTAIKSIFSKKNIDFERLCLLNPWVALQHAAIINDTLRKWCIPAAEVDAIASHGQTVYHAPKSLHRKAGFGNSTLQIGDGDHLSVATGITVISDFRQKHIAAGGEGAPLAVYGDYLVFSKEGEDRILLNIGGIANFTFLPGTRDAAAIFSTDTGPGNTMMDAWMQQVNGKYFDEDAALARQGTVNGALLSALKNNSFFEQPFPKTTGPELFNLHYLQTAKEQSDTVQLNAADTMATLNQFSADTIVAAIEKCMKGKSNCHIYSSGGGMHNPLLMERIKKVLPHFSYSTTSELGVHPDAKEAVLFAILANECICGDGSYLKKNIEGMPAISMGKISFPD